MSGRVHADAQVKVPSTPTQSFILVQNRLLQKKSLLGGVSGLVSEFADSRRKQLVSQPPLIQAKLTIGQPNDQYEQEADRVAEQVMRMPEPRLQRQVEPEEEEEGEEEPIQTKLTDSTQVQRLGPESEGELEGEEIRPKIIAEEVQEVTPEIRRNIQSIKGAGQPLSESERTFFEPRFGADFGNVRMHSDTRAAHVARSVNARAFTMGRDVVFGGGQYSPGTSSGRKLLAHELTHVVQQKMSNSAIKNTLQRKWERKKGKAHVWIAGSNRDTYSGLLRGRYHQPKSFYQCLRPIKVKESGVFGTDVFKGDTFDASLLSRKNAVSLALKGYFKSSLLNRWVHQWYGAKGTSIVPDDDIRKPSKKGQAIKNLVFAGHGWGRSEIGTFKISSAKDPGGSYLNAKARKFPNKCLFAKGAKARFVGCQTSTFANAFAKKYMRKGSLSMGTKSTIFVKSTTHPAHPADPTSITKVAFKVRFVKGYNPVTNLSKPLTKSEFHKSRYWGKYLGKR